MNEKILTFLPYKPPFLFVDQIEFMGDKHIIGNYYFSEKSDFYSGHFVNQPVTPGVLLLECMGQIGLVCFGIHLFRLWEKAHPIRPLLTNVNADFHKAVYPNTRVWVRSDLTAKKQNYIRCSIRMTDAENEIIATATAGCKFL